MPAMKKKASHLYPKDDASRALTIQGNIVLLVFSSDSVEHLCHYVMSSAVKLIPKNLEHLLL